MQIAYSINFDVLCYGINMKSYTDGYMSFKDYKTYYKVFGSANLSKTPLLVLHGGPGSAHNYMLPLAELAKSGRQVVFYDQLGGGLSDHPSDKNLWSLELFVEELKAIREHLHLDKVVLLGHSWGGMLAAEYMCQQPKGVEKVVFASSMLSMPLYREEVEKLKKDLPPKTYKALIAHERAGTTHSEAYNKAMEIYNKRHIYRGRHFPPKLHDPKGTFGTVPYETLWGVSEAYPNGVLKDWNRLDDLSKIKVPTLVTSGQYDELTPRQAIATYRSLPNAQLYIVTAGSHLAHVEFPEEYLGTVAKFFG